MTSGYHDTCQFGTGLDYIQLSADGLRAMGADGIALEDLHVKGMVQNHALAGAISDVGMGEFRRQIEYKAAWYGRTVEVIDRFAPTSKTCSECGVVQDKMPLKVRQWT